VPTLTAAVPILPARDVEATARFYRDRLGFQIVHAEREYGIVARDGVEVHFWGPSGIDPAETDGMCRIGVNGIDELYEQCGRAGIVHPNGPLQRKPWGTREFAATDLDNNLITFFER
jgi:catechol 2,3-dioxygenase-like lactoylglutathione lyase family enzyme